MNTSTSFIDLLVLHFHIMSIFVIRIKTQLIQSVHYVLIFLLIIKQQYFLRNIK